MLSALIVKKWASLSAHDLLPIDILARFYSIQFGYPSWWKGLAHSNNLHLSSAISMYSAD